MPSSSETPVSPVTGRTPDLTFSIAAINAQPVELDSTPTSPEKVREGSRATAVEQEHLKEVAQKRKADPAVLQDIPQLPGADELEQVEASNNTESGTRDTGK